MIEIKNFSIKYIKDYYSLYNINLQIDNNTILIGDETSGNNFLLRLLAKIDKGYEGEIFVDNVNLKQIKDKNLNLAYIPKTPYLFENKTVLDNLIFPLKIRKISKIEAILRVKTAIKPYIFKIFEIFIDNYKNNNFNPNKNFEQIFNKTNKYLIQNQDTNNNEKANSLYNQYHYSDNDKRKIYETNITQNYNLKDNVKNKNLEVQNLDLDEEKFENIFNKFLNLKVKKLDYSTKKILTLLRAKIREPKYILIENFFENLNENYFELANEIILDFNTSTVIATQSNTTTPPAYKTFKQIVFDTGSILNI